MEYVSAQRNTSGLTLAITRQRCLGWGVERKIVMYKVRLSQTENKRTENVMPEKCNLKKEFKSWSSCIEVWQNRF